MTGSPNESGEPPMVSRMRNFPAGDVWHIPARKTGTTSTPTVDFLRELDEWAKEIRAQAWREGMVAAEEAEGTYFHVENPYDGSRTDRPWLDAGRQMTAAVAVPHATEACHNTFEGETQVTNECRDADADLPTPCKSCGGLWSHKPDCAQEAESARAAIHSLIQMRREIAGLTAELAAANAVIAAANAWNQTVVSDGRFVVHHIVLHDILNPIHEQEGSN